MREYYCYFPALMYPITVQKFVGVWGVAFTPLTLAPSHKHT
jgi:hypothetical protein